MDLQEYRGKLDQIDRQITALFAQRMDIVREIGAYKAAHGLPVLAQGRQQEILDRVGREAGPELKYYAQALFRTLMDLSRSYQSDLMAKKGTLEKPAYGLLGRVLGHSFSPQLHKLLGGYDYGLFAMPPENVGGFMALRQFKAINVTIPYKQVVMSYCDEIDDAAQKIGAVNTVVNRDGRLYGYNTDLEGFLYMARRAGISMEGKKVVILGSGGTSHTVRAAARAAGAAKIVIVSRRGENNYGNLSLHSDARVLINTTPVGMFPNCGASPVSLDSFPRLEGVLDVVYNPLKTALILAAEARGIPCSGGLPMLTAQARAASQLFTGSTISDGAMEKVLNTLTNQVRNIVLIGMPGCGKSTLGHALAQRLKKNFLDLDALVEDMAGMSIPEIFRQYGEQHFRDLESQAVKKAGLLSGEVISTGGGVVLRRENWDHLRQNSIIIHIRRPLEALAGDGRPLTQAQGVDALWRQRKPLYEALADAEIDNNGSPEEALEAILEVLQQ